MKTQKGFVDLDTSYRGGKPEMVIHIDRDRAADLGVPIANIAMTVRNLMGDDKITEITADGDRHDVRMKLDEPFRQRAEDLAAVKVRSVTGQLVTLANVANVNPGTGPGKIERQNRQRQITIFANLKSEDLALGDASTMIDKAAKRIVPPTMSTGWIGHGRHHARVVRPPVLGADSGRHHRLPGAGRAVRELPPPLHHHAVPAALVRRRLRRSWRSSRARSTS